MEMPEQVCYRNKETQFGTGMIRNPTEMSDNGMSMPVASSVISVASVVMPVASAVMPVAMAVIPMPSYNNRLSQHSITRTK
jgi:hypothetical protein